MRFSPCSTGTSGLVGYLNLTLENSMLPEIRSGVNPFVELESMVGFCENQNGGNVINKYHQGC